MHVGLSDNTYNHLSGYEIIMKQKARCVVV